MEEALIIDKLPMHIAVIMDGNGRWAKRRGKERIFGHSNGVTAVKEVIKGCAEIGVKYLTLYTFSSENWKRPKNEVDALMQLLSNAIVDELDELNKKGVRLKMIGDLDSLPEIVRKGLSNGIKVTEGNDVLTLTLALSYSGKWEIVQAAKQIAREVVANKICINDISEDIFSKYLSTESTPDVDLMIRTGGEHRLSNYLLWQMAYAELCFLDVFWPDFRKKHLLDALYKFQQKERRFGRI